MSSRPPSLLLLLTGLLHIWPCARGQSSYTIDNVGLTIQPSTVNSGTTVRIRCWASVSHSNMPDLTHAFQIMQDGNPIYSSNTTKDLVEYELNPARAADSGIYTCRVAVKEKHKTSVKTTLDVTGLQTPSLRLNNLTPYENEEFAATCIAPGERGLLTFRFYQKFNTRNPEMISQRVLNGNETTTTLALSHIGEASFYCDYEISLGSGNQRSNSSKEIQVTVRVLNITPNMTVLPSSEIYEDEIFEVTCKVASTLRQLENFGLFLKKDASILKHSKALILIHRFNARDVLSGELECKAEWGSVQKETYEPITVRERFSKPWLIVEPAEIFEGDDVKLSCAVSIYDTERVNNRTLRFSFYKDNMEVKRNAQTYFITAHPDKNGNYTCKVQLQLGSIIKESQPVVVKAKVPVSQPVLSVVGGKLVLGKQFQLLCHSDNGTLPITYILHGPNREPRFREVRKPGEWAIFNTSAIFRGSDLSNFLCQAKNSNQRPPEISSAKQMLYSTIIIEPVSKPLLTVLPDTSGISEGNDVTLMCSLQRGSPPINFTWYQTENKSVLYSLTSNQLEGTYPVHIANRQQAGKYFCVSTNPANEPKQSNIVTISVKLAAWKRGLIAVSCILLILALLLVFAFKTRLLHYKRKRTGNLSVKSVGTKAERLSLTQAEVNEVANVTPGMMGKSIWSEHVSGSDSDEQNNPEKPEVQYAEVQTKRADPNVRAPEKAGTDTVYSEVRNSQQGVPEPADGVPVEYAQLNRDADDGSSDRSNHGDHGLATDGPVGVDESAVEVNVAVDDVAVDVAEQGE